MKISSREICEKHDRENKRLPKISTRENNKHGVMQGHVAPPLNLGFPTYCGKNNAFWPEYSPKYGAGAEVDFFFWILGLSIEFCVFQMTH